MRGSAGKRYLILAVVSVVLSLVIIRWHSTANVSFCQFTPGCHSEEPRGTITEKTYGFPLAYKKVTSFRPSDGGKQVSIENQAFSIPSVIVSALFWFGLLYLLTELLIRPKRTAATDTPPTVGETHER